MKNLKDIARYIVEDLEYCRFDDITDSSGYYIVKEFANGTDRAVDVYKSSDGGNHYVIYCSYEDGDFDYKYTDDLSVEQLEVKLREFYLSGNNDFTKEVTTMQDQKRVLQISLDILVGNECDGEKLAEEVASELELRAFTVLGASFIEDMTKCYEEQYPELLKENT